MSKIDNDIEVLALKLKLSVNLPCKLNLFKMLMLSIERHMPQSRYSEVDASIEQFPLGKKTAFSSPSCRILNGSFLRSIAKRNPQSVERWIGSTK